MPPAQPEKSLKRVLSFRNKVKFYIYINELIGFTGRTKLKKIPWKMVTFTAVKRLGTRVNTRVIFALPVTFPLHPTKFPQSTSATRAISVLSSIILPLQTFFSRVLLLRQQPFWSENLPPERPTTTIAIKTQVVKFRYELVNSTRKFTIVAEIVSLLKKIFKRDAPV